MLTPHCRTATTQLEPSARCPRAPRAGGRGWRRQAHGSGSALRQAQLRRQRHPARAVACAVRVCSTEGMGPECAAVSGPWPHLNYMRTACVPCLFIGHCPSPRVATPARLVLTVAFLRVCAPHKVRHKEDVVGGVRAPHVLAVVAARADHGVGHRGAGAAKGERARTGGGAAGAPRRHALDERQRSLCQSLQLCEAQRVAECYQDGR